jgi:predicted dinucleotide-binding enzyme
MFNRIAMIGLGDIGLPTAILFASRDQQVIGVDRSQHAVDTINARRIHIVALIIVWSTVAKPPQGRGRAASQAAVVVAPVGPATASARAPARTRRDVLERRSAARLSSHRDA